MTRLLDPHPTERFLEAAIVCLALACLLSSCTHVTVAPAPATVPTTEARQLGGMLTLKAPDGTEMWIDNRESFKALADMAEGITGKVTILAGTKEAIGLRKAKNASDAAVAGQQIEAATEGQRIAADQAVKLQTLENEAAAAALAAP